MTRGFFCDICGVAFQLEKKEYFANTFEGSGSVLDGIHDHYCNKCAEDVKQAIDELKRIKRG